MNYLWNCCILEIERICRFLPMLLMLSVVTVFVTTIATFVWSGNPVATDVSILVICLIPTNSHEATTIMNLVINTTLAVINRLITNTAHVVINCLVTASTHVVINCLVTNATHAVINWLITYTTLVVINSLITMLITSFFSRSFHIRANWFGTHKDFICFHCWRWIPAWHAWYCWTPYDWLFFLFFCFWS